MVWSRPLSTTWPSRGTRRRRRWGRPGACAGLHAGRGEGKEGPRRAPRGFSSGAGAPDFPLADAGPRPDRARPADRGPIWHGRLAVGFAIRGPGGGPAEAAHGGPRRPRAPSVAVASGRDPAVPGLVRRARWQGRGRHPCAGPRAAGRGAGAGAHHPVLGHHPPAPGRRREQAGACPEGGGVPQGPSRLRRRADPGPPAGGKGLQARP